MAEGDAGVNEGGAGNDKIGIDESDEEEDEDEEEELVPEPPLAGGGRAPSEEGLGVDINSCAKSVSTPDLRI